MGVHVSDAAQINKQGIPFLNAKQHTIDRQARDDASGDKYRTAR